MAIQSGDLFFIPDAEIVLITGEAMVAVMPEMITVRAPETLRLEIIEWLGE
jgi:hypothetical protein